MKIFVLPLQGQDAVVHTAGNFSLPQSRITNSWWKTPAIFADCTTCSKSSQHQVTEERRTGVEIVGHNNVALPLQSHIVHRVKHYSVCQASSSPLSQCTTSTPMYTHSLHPLAPTPSCPTYEASWGGTVRTTDGP